MDPSSDELEEVTGPTLQHYDQRADAFWEGTRGHDVTQNIAAMLNHIHGERPFTLLDFGCGPGRDLKAFAELGHVAIGLDGAPRFVEMARIHSGCEVWRQDFLALDLPRGHFDGIFRQCVAVSCAEPRVASRPAPASRRLEDWRRSVQFHSAWSRPGRVERRTLWRVSCPRKLASFGIGGGLRRA